MKADPGPSSPAVAPRPGPGHCPPMDVLHAPWRTGGTGVRRWQVEAKALRVQRRL